MIAYAFVDKSTNVIDYVSSWGNKELDTSYPVPDTQYVVKLLEDDFIKFKEIILTGQRVRILNVDTLEYETFTEVVVKQPSIDDYIVDLDYRLSLKELGL